MSVINVHYAFQACDVKSHQNQPRFCGDDRTELSKKSLKSFLDSVQYCVNMKPNTIHTVAIIDDQSTYDLKQFFIQCKQQYESQSITINIINLSEPGLSSSIKNCYSWLSDNGKDLVYQLQDDFIFIKSTVYEMIDVFYQMFAETQTHCIVHPWNDSWLWQTFYRNKSTPRLVVVGKYRYWIQYYDMSCSFLTSHEQFCKHWDLYDKFLFLVDNRKDSSLENISLNYMLTQRGVLGLVPINSLAFHMQTELEKDPHIQWEPLWNSIDVS